MCGIVGTVALGSAAPHGAATRLGTRLLRHRGPDEAGVVARALPWGRAELGMARLAIVDAAARSGVPLAYAATGALALAFNGEVYNWRALRAELGDGAPWETACDAEVVARAWRRWGLRALDAFNGMFALAIVDPREGVVVLARDRAGEKPLYYAVDPAGDALHFASEAKALPLELAEVPCPELDALEADCLEATPFRGVRRLGPGEVLVLRGPGDVRDPRPAAWWRLPRGADEAMTWERAVEATRELVVDAVRLRADAEVPVAVMLSGGLDSAIVQAVARAERLYTVTFPADGLDNLPDARACAAGAGAPAAVTFDRAGLLRALPEVAWHLDTPATWTAVCQWHLGARMAADGVKVVLSGEGADELFHGYARYRLLWHLDRAAADPVLAAYGGARRNALGGSDADVLARVLDRSPGGAARAHAAALVARFAAGGGLVADAARVEWHTTMQVLLRMADRMMAAHSIENRSPFLDPRLVALAASMPDRHKIDGRRTKAVLREVARRLGVPPAVADADTKRGLAVPWDRWQAADPAAPRGAWDRAGFAALMRDAWRRAFFDGARSPAALPDP